MSGRMQMVEDRQPAHLSLNERSFRSALGHFATGVTVVTAPGRPEPLGMTVNSFTSVSLDPPLVLFSVARTMRSLPALMDAASFGISVLGTLQGDLSSRFARAGSEKWAGVAFDVGPVLGSPLLQEAIARFECTPFATHDGGDHVLFLARVVHFETADHSEPLVFFRGRYRALVPEQ